MSTLRDRFDTLDVLVTVLVFVQLMASVLVGSESHKLVRVLLAVSAVLFLVLWGTHRWYRVVHAIHDFIPNFSVRANRGVWVRTRRQYRYLGISGGTFEKEFTLFLEQQNFPAKCNLRFLLLMPFSESVRRSKEHELSQEPRAEEVASASRRIEESARSYSGLRARGVDIEVRFVPEYNGFWLHLVDDREALVGFLLKGESNLEGPVIRLLGGTNNLLLRFYIDEFERQWKYAVPAETYFSKKQA